MLVTFLLVAVAWVFFRAENLNHAFEVLRGIFSASLFEGSKLIPARLTIAVLAFVLIEWFGRRDEFALERLLLDWPRVLRWLFYLFLAALVLVYQGPKQGFIYFQF